MKWLLFVYKVPPEPSAKRVYVWRKLKRLGALLLHDAVWVLPDNPITKEQLQWLAAEIEEAQGEAFVWAAQMVQPQVELRLIADFTSQAASEYREILSALEATDPNLAEISRRYQQVAARDYFHSELGPSVREALLSARGGNDV